MFGYQKTNKNKKFLTVLLDQRRREVPMATRDQLSCKQFADDFSPICTTTTIRLTGWVCCDTGVQAPKENRSSLELPKRVLDLKAQFSARKQGRKLQKDQNNIIMGGREKRPFNFCGVSFPIGILYI